MMMTRCNILLSLCLYPILKVVKLTLLQMYNLAYDKAKEMLQNNRRVLEQIVEQLLMFENLTGHVSSYFSIYPLKPQLLERGVLKPHFVFIYGLYAPIEEGVCVSFYALSSVYFYRFHLWMHLHVCMSLLCAWTSLGVF